MSSAIALLFPGKAASDKKLQEELRLAAIQEAATKLGISVEEAKMRLRHIHAQAQLKNTERQIATMQRRHIVK